MNWLAEFMGMTARERDHYDGQFEAGTFAAWGYWMTEVEPRIREKELWVPYLKELVQIVAATINSALAHHINEVVYQGISKMMSATLEQRSEALRRVLE